VRRRRGSCGGGSAIGLATREQQRLSDENGPFWFTRRLVGGPGVRGRVGALPGHAGPLLRVASVVAPASRQELFQRVLAEPVVASRQPPQYVAGLPGRLDRWSGVDLVSLTPTTTDRPTN
jgi:hypothetical protein